MGSSTSFLLIGGKLIYIQLGRRKKSMADEQFHQANNKWDIPKTQEEKKKKQTNNNNKRHTNTRKQSKQTVVKNKNKMLGR